MKLQESEVSALIVATGRGDRAAFAALYRQTSPKILGIILRMVKSRSEAEDILQDVFLRIWLNAKSYSPDPGFAWAWLVLIARNRTIDVVRARVPQRVVSQEDLPEGVADVPDPVNGADDLVTRDLLRHCLATLEPLTRDLVLAAYYEGWSREELAERYGRPVNTIKTWLSRGLTALNACMTSLEVKS